MATQLLDRRLRRAASVRAMRQELSTPRVMSTTTPASRVFIAATVIRACCATSKQTLSEMSYFGLH